MIFFSAAVYYLGGSIFMTKRDAPRMNVKTNVSILQEMMVKKGTVPNYELIHDGGGTHINTFTYRVTCDGYVADGTGRCKKDAKHTAAKNMLDIIVAARRLPELPATPADSPVRTPLPQPLPSSPINSSNEPFLNAIGELKDLCATSELEEPQYNMISDVGPPHARIFTYQCVVSAFREEGRATTKKQAKHEASRKMLERLLEVVKDLNDKDEIYSNLKKCDRQEEAGRDLALLRYPELSKAPTKKINLGVKLTHYHTKMKTSYTDDSVPTRQEVLAAVEKVTSLIADYERKFDPAALESLKDCIETVLTPLNIEVSVAIFESETNNSKSVFIKLNTTPEIMECEVGADPVEIEMKATSKAFKTFRTLMN